MPPDALVSYIVPQKIVYISDKPIGLQIAEYIADSIRNNLSVDALCRKFAMSRSRLYLVTQALHARRHCKIYQKMQDPCHSSFHRSQSPETAVGNLAGSRFRQLRVFPSCFQERNRRIPRCHQRRFPMAEVKICSKRLVYSPPTTPATKFGAYMPYAECGGSPPVSWVSLRIKDIFFAKVI